MIEVTDLLEQVEVLQQNGTAGACLQGAVGVGHP